MPGTSRWREIVFPLSLLPASRGWQTDVEICDRNQLTSAEPLVISGPERVGKLSYTDIYHIALLADRVYYPIYLLTATDNQPGEVGSDSFPDFTFIWMEFITLDNVARTPLHKIISILEFLILFCHQSRVTIRIFLSLLGKLNATPQYAVLGKLHLRQLQMALLVQWKPRILPLCHPISITHQMRRHFLWWNKDRFLAIKPNPATHIIFSYASMYDWGAHIEPKGLLFHGVLCSRPIPTPYLVSTVMIATETVQVCCTS